MAKSAVKAENKIMVKLFALADERGLSSVALAKLLSVHVNSVRNWRAGKVNPSIVDMCMLAGQLGFTLKVEPMEESANG